MVDRLDQVVVSRLGVLGQTYRFDVVVFDCFLQKISVFLALILSNFLMYGRHLLSVDSKIHEDSYYKWHDLAHLKLVHLND